MPCKRSNSELHNRIERAKRAHRKVMFSGENSTLVELAEPLLASYVRELSEALDLIEEGDNDARSSFQLQWWAASDHIKLVEQTHFPNAELPVGFFTMKERAAK